MTLPHKFIFKHDGNTYTAERMPTCEYLVSWDASNYCSEAGSTTYAASAVEHHVKYNDWIIQKESFSEHSPPLGEA